MLVEHWSNLESLCQTIRPMLAPAPKRTMGQIIDWIQSQPNKHHGIPQGEVDYIVNVLEGFKSQLPAPWPKKLSDGQYFLRSLNNGPNAEWIEHKGNCTWWDYFWYDNSCHVEPKPEVFDCRTIYVATVCRSFGCFWYDNSCHAEDQPPPPPPPLPCSAHTTQNSCLSAGCHWWGGSCHDSPEPPPPPPPPPPVIPECSDHKEQTQCLANGCYWWAGSCHDTPEVIPPGTSNPIREFAKQVKEYCGTIPLTDPLGIANCGILHAILTITADVFDFLGKKD